MTAFNPGSNCLPVLIFNADDAGMDTNGANLSPAIDTLGFSHLIIVASHGTMNSSGVVILQVQDCATSGGSYADISGAVMTATQGVDDDSVQYGYVDLSATDRYIKVEATVSDLGSSESSVVGVLCNPQYVGDGGPTFAPEFDV